MFNAEKLLGKIISETLGGSSSGKLKKGRARNSLLDSLTSGAGLMTAIGLGVGAYEVLKEQKQIHSGRATGPSVPPLPTGSAAHVLPPPPPPPPAEKRQAMTMPPVPGQGNGEEHSEVLSMEMLAVRMIQVMIAGAHADGTLDEAEEKAILHRLRGAELNSEEKMFLLDELHQPKSVQELTAGIDDPSLARNMYMLAVATIEMDTEAERSWLNALGDQMGLSPEIRRFIEDQV